MEADDRLWCGHARPVAVVGPGVWRAQVVIEALRALGVPAAAGTDGSPTEVLVVLAGPPAAGPRAVQAGLVLVEGDAPASGRGRAARALPRDCSPERLAGLLQQLPRQRHPGGPEVDSAAVRAPVRAAGGPTLSPREREVLRLLAEGGRNADIARDLGVSRHTVRTHVQNLLGKLGAANRVAAVAAAHRLDLLR